MPPSLPSLTDGVVILRPWRKDDEAAVFTACQDPLIARFYPIPQPYTIESARDFLVACRRDWEHEHERPFAITGAGDEVLGSIARHGPLRHRASFGYWLAFPARGRGFATRALRLIAAWTFATTDAVRLELCTDIDNEASGRVAERAGFRREGLRRAWYVNRDQQPTDVIFYVRVRGE